MKLSIFLPLAAFLSMTAAEIAIINDGNRCLTEAAAVAGCISQYDTACTCTSPAFRDTVQVCLKDACTAEDAEGMINLFRTNCARVTS
ncbi:hypothetical protein PENSUB_3630 [Penicillium subrubescens]|uniref:CFEM domain-containing protein n=1 Tax=Penicillium subrubescens TaxID=1316194 RepID=A0A1Q5UEA8_9EURO|nr:hypothetical protein PENSUB_3630 [Penicillium subrubescens]